MKNICNTRKNGLSPLARGARHSQADPATALRFIPAGAGNTPASSVYSARSPVYPRWRGEHVITECSSPRALGLSPLARGTPSLIFSSSIFMRFIPAGAGNTAPEHLPQCDTPVYPRWRGEHTVISLPLGDRNGLSPLARGTRNSLRIRQQKYRFIPAGAGNTALLCRSRSVPTVYPRWRGEHGNRSLNSTPASGLSPLARGTHLSPYEFYAPSRFIPAGAGNTASHSIRWFSMTVYPRWRGEHVTWRRPAIDFSGLSPLARGTLEPVFLSARNFRFIPAGAGNTVRIGFENLYAPVYPRWRGEHGYASNIQRWERGLSPLARGTRVSSCGAGSPWRFIPAGAGNTLNITYY